MASGRVKVTLNQKILVHLLDYTRWPDRIDAPAATTQQGIADTLRVRRSHVTLALQTMARHGLVQGRTTRIVGGRRRKKAYALTPLGYERARETHSFLAAMPVHLHDGTEVALSRVSQTLGVAVEMRELLPWLRPDGVLDSRPLGRPSP